MEFICSVFENYHKRRLIEFASSRRDQKLLSHYSKFYKRVEGIDVEQLSENEFKVTSKCMTDVYTVHKKFATCDCLYGRGGKYCKHMCAVEKKFQFQMTTHPVLNVEDKIKCAKVAFGSEIPVEFYSSMDLTENVTSVVAADTITGEVTLVHENQSIPLINYKDSLDKLRVEFNRMADILETCPSSSNSAIINKTIKKMQAIKTPGQVMSFMAAKLSSLKTKKIRVQPTSLTRRKERGISKGGGRIQSGRPANTEKMLTFKKKSTARTKRKHNLSLSIENNTPSAKLH